jgi:hypothetical protein
LPGRVSHAWTQCQTQKCQRCTTSPIAKDRDCMQVINKHCAPATAGPQPIRSQFRTTSIGLKSSCLLESIVQSCGNRVTMLDKRAQSLSFFIFFFSSLFFRRTQIVRWIFLVSQSYCVNSHGSLLTATGQVGTATTHFFASLSPAPRPTPHAPRPRRVGRASQQTSPSRWHHVCDG